jgi:Zn-finger nucleic acid-binding protein
MTGPYRKAPKRRARHDYFCRACGRDVARTERRCPECGAAVATVRCAACFHMNVPEDALCTGCGEPLGLEPVGEPCSLSCSCCHKAFSKLVGTGGALYDCGACGGQFVEHGLLRDLLEQRDVYGASAPRRPKRFKIAPEPVAYVACPVCGLAMNRKNFGRSSGVIVDTCSAHGTWFDAGELPHVLAFVESGGLAEVRRAEQTARALTASKQRVEDVESSLRQLSAPVHAQADVALVRALLHFVRALVDRS